MGNLYTSTTFMEHNSHPDYKYEMDAPTHEHDGINPSCGDEISLALEIEGGVIRKVGLSGSGCAISSASASILADMMEGMEAEEAKRLARLFIAMIRGDAQSEEELEELEDAVAFRGLSKMPARTKCAVLAWHTLEEAVDQWQAQTNPDGI